MYPKRFKELINGGSIYWVIKGKLCIRQRILNIERFIDIDNIKRCKFELDDDLFLTIPFKERPFQGWRYLAPEDAPVDMPTDIEIDEAMPEEMRHELSEMGLL